MGDKVHSEVLAETLLTPDNAFKTATKVLETEPTNIVNVCVSGVEDITRSKVATEIDESEKEINTSDVDAIEKPDVDTNLSKYQDEDIYNAGRSREPNSNADSIDKGMEIGNDIE